MIKSNHSNSSNKNNSKTVSPNKLAVFFIFVLLSFIFWLLNYLAGDYTNNYKCTVYYENLPIDKVIVGSPTQTLTVSLRAKGYKLLKKELENVNIGIQVNMSSISLLDSITQKYYILSSAFYSQIAAAYGNGYEIVGLTPDTLFMHFDKEYTKKLQVKANVTLELKKQYRVTHSMKISMDSLVVRGPKRVLDTMLFVFTKPYVFLNKSASFSATLEIDKSQFFYRNVKISKDKIDVNWDIDKYTERFISVDVNSSNSDINIQTFPQKVNIYFKVNLKDYDKISPNSFNVGIELTDKKYYSDNRALLKVFKKPDFVDIERIVPDNVEFIIKQRK